jgi:hypothetical protein
MMIEFVIELFGTAFVYGFFARRKAARRRKQYDRGETVCFAGFLGGAYAPADIQEAGRSTSLRASKTEFWVESKWPLTPQRREIPRPAGTAKIEFPATESQSKLWYKVPAARYVSSDGIVEIYCQRLDVELVRAILCDRAVGSESTGR